MIFSKTLEGAGRSKKAGSYFQHTVVKPDSRNALQQFFIYKMFLPLTSEL